MSLVLVCLVFGAILLLFCLVSLAYTAGYQRGRASGLLWGGTYTNREIKGISTWSEHSEIEPLKIEDVDSSLLNDIDLYDFEIEDGD